MSRIGKIKYVELHVMNLEGLGLVFIKLVHSLMWRFNSLAMLKSYQLNKDQSCLQYSLQVSAYEYLEAAWFPSTVLSPFGFLSLSFFFIPLVYLLHLIICVHTPPTPRTIS